MSLRLLLTALAATLALAAPAGGAEPRASMPDIEDEVMCVSCNVPLNIAESPQASRQRELIRTLVDQGLTKAQVKRRLVAEYGTNVLAMPDDEGVGLVAYLVPILGILALLAVAAVLLPRWRHRTPAGPLPVAAGGPGAVTDAELRRLDDDLRHSG